MGQNGRLNLTIDAGNTCIKAALFEEAALVRHIVLEPESVSRLNDFCRDALPQRCAIADVAAHAAAIDQVLRGLGIPVLHVNGTTPALLHNAYRTPETLGADRWAAAVGARALQPHGALLVIDAGTCVTYDYVDAHNRYLGGNISPGLDMRLMAMHEHTARLPLVKAEGDLPELGHDTETALRAGAQLGLQLEMEGYIRRMARRESGLTVFLTGGQTALVRTDSPCRTDEYLVLRGLNSILRYTYEP